MQRMLHSSKFWTFIVTQVLVLVTYFVTSYAAPQAAKDILVVLAFVEAVSAVVIAAIFGEDAAAWLSGNKPKAPADWSQLGRDVLVAFDTD